MFVIITQTIPSIALKHGAIVLDEPKTRPLRLRNYFVVLNDFFVLTDDSTYDATISKAATENVRN